VPWYVRMEPTRWAYWQMLRGAAIAAEHPWDGSGNLVIPEIVVRTWELVASKVSPADAVDALVADGWSVESIMETALEVGGTCTAVGYEAHDRYEAEVAAFRR